MKLLTLARDLQRRKARERQQQFVAEGVRTAETLLDSRLRVAGVLVTADARESTRGAALVARAEHRGIPVVEVSDAELASAADTDTPQGVLAVADIPDVVIGPPTERARYLVLDAVQDPGNVGTAVRSAAALGVTATIALPGTVDVWNAKVVRSTMGAVFRHPVVSMTFEELLAFLGSASPPVPLWAADMHGEPVDGLGAAMIPARLALVVSNEGAGVSPHVAAAATRTVCVPMTDGVESLNVAAATAILLYALRGSHVAGQ